MSEPSSLSGEPAGAGVGASDGTPDPAAAPAGPTAGDLLREAREAAGLHIGSLAASLKVPVKKLEALEQDRFDLLPDLVFARALASSICRTLKVDAAPVLERLPRISPSKLSQQSTSINTPFRSPGDGPSPSIWTQISRPAVLAGLALLMAALVLIFLPSVKPDVSVASLSGESPNTLPASVTASAVGEGGGPALQAVDAVAAASAPGVSGVSVPKGSPVALVAGSPTASVLVATQAAGSLPVAPVINPAVAVSPLAGASAASQSANAAQQALPVGIVIFRAKGESWVEVTDAKGVVVLRRTLLAGETAGATGALPLAAVVGRADATQVQVRGQAFDLNAVSRDNVARFEVK